MVCLQAVLSLSPALLTPVHSTLCSSEITFKTDPKNTDYVAEHGAQRNFEPWRDTKAEEEDRLAKLEEEENNPMKALENRQVDSKREMDILDALQDIREKNARLEKTGQAAAMDLVDKLGLQEIEDEEERRRREEAEEDERLVRQVFSKESVPSGSSSKSSESPETPDTAPPTLTVKRKADVLNDAPAPKPSTLEVKSALQPPVKKKKLGAMLGIKVVKKKVAV